jgi:hypothetical protein
MKRDRIFLRLFGLLWIVSWFLACWIYSWQLFFTGLFAFALGGLQISSIKDEAKKKDFVEPRELHEWYLESTATLRKGSYNPEAVKPYENLTLDQKYIDVFIAGKLNRRFKERTL